MSGTGKRRAGTPSRPDVRQGEAFLASRMALLNYLARELQKVTHQNENWREEEGGQDRWPKPSRVCLTSFRLGHTSVSAAANLPDAAGPARFIRPTASDLTLQAGTGPLWASPGNPNIGAGVSSL